MKSNPEVIELDEADLESKLDQIEAVMGADDGPTFSSSSALVRASCWDCSARRSSASVGSRECCLALRRNGVPTFCPPPRNRPGGEVTSARISSLGIRTSRRAPATGGDSAETACPAPTAAGHGRIPASDYTGCAKVVVTHASLCPGDACPHCSSGTVYRQSRWSPVVRLKGQPPVTGQVYQLERLRCEDCGEIFTAELPEEAGTEKYDPPWPPSSPRCVMGKGCPGIASNGCSSLRAFLSLHPTSGNRSETPRSEAREMRHQHLVGLAAQGDLVHNDDTTMRVLELMEKTKRQQPLLEEDPKRRGVFTTGVVSLAEGRPDHCPVLYRSASCGRKPSHAAPHASRNCRRPSKCATPCRATCPQICA